MADCLCVNCFWSDISANRCYDPTAWVCRLACETISMKSQNLFRNVNSLSLSHYLLSFSHYLTLTLSHPHPPSLTLSHSLSHTLSFTLSLFIAISLSHSHCDKANLAARTNLLVVSKANILSQNIFVSVSTSRKIFAAPNKNKNITLFGATPLRMTHFSHFCFHCHEFPIATWFIFAIIIIYIFTFIAKQLKPWRFFVAAIFDLFAFVSYSLLRFCCSLEYRHDALEVEAKEQSKFCIKFN